MSVFVAALDPAWNTDDGGGERGANTHFETGSPDAMARSIRMSPGWIDTGSALVWMWATTLAVLEGDAHAFANRLHVRPCSGWVWCKTEDVSRVLVRYEVDGDFEADVVAPTGLFIPTRIPGLGFWQRCEHEHLWLCRRGDVALPPKGSQERSVIYAPRGDVHSAKPEAAWRVIERTTFLSTGLTAGGVEYFSRNRRRGWSAFGRLDGEKQPLRFEGAGPEETWIHHATKN